MDFEITSFTADKYTADVGEDIAFNWEIVGPNVSQIWINWGDGSTNEEFDPDEGSTYHSYDREGIYNVTLYAFDDFGEKLQKSLVQPIIIKNEAPQFNIAFSNDNPFEDEAVSISVVGLVDSDHDKQHGVITYIYDMGIEQINTTELSIDYSWENMGEYPVSITAIDDQGATKQVTETINIINKVPIAEFTLGADIPATWSFSNDLTGKGKIPLGWIEGSQGARDNIYVVSKMDSHSKILEISGNTPYAQPNIFTQFPAQDYGTIEYHFKNTDVSEPLGVVTLQQNNQEVLSVFTEDSEWKYKSDNFLFDYDGTYSFTNDNNYVVPNGWSAQTSPSCSAMVMEGEKNHNKVLQISDNGLGEAHCWNQFTPQPYGTIEFWMFVDDAYACNLIQIVDQSADVIYFMIRYDKFYCNNQDLGVIALDDTWYHISINFETTEGLYKGLGQYKWNVEIDGTRYRDFTFNHNGLPYKFFCSSSSSGTGTIYLLDAVSYSWDLNYEIGDNLNYQLYPLNINNCNDPINDEWTHIRIDFVVDITQVPEENYYGITQSNRFRILIDGISSDLYSFSDIDFINRIKLGTYCTSNQKAYIDCIGVSWDNKYNIGDNYNYYKSSYYGTHDFRHDVLEEVPKGWIIEPFDAESTGLYDATYSFEGGDRNAWEDCSYSDCSTTIRDFDGHKDVMKLWDNHQNGYAMAANSFPYQIEGDVEFWWAPCSNARVYVTLCNGNYIATRLRTEVGYFHGNCYPIIPYQLNEWYHIRIHFDCTTRHFDVWINGELVEESPFFDNTITSINNMQIFTDGGQYSYYGFFDAIGYSWDEEYNIGDNKYSPLDISVINEGGDFCEVLQINDNSISKEVSIKEILSEEQTQGTIQWYAKSSNVEQKIWNMNLKDGTNTELSITMEDNKWRYSTGGIFNDIPGLGTPDSNHWYHHTLKFDSNSNTFTLNIDDIESNPVSLNQNFNQISAIEITSGDSDTGIALIDAIGYSWDHHYDIDDNKLSMISYPEKSNVLFSASDSSDTESDLNTLRYYWNFDDGTSGFGKNVAHEFKQSGRYNVSLAVKDDNGEIDYEDKLVVIHNKNPEIEIISPQDNFIINEGETINFNSISTDDITDWAELIYLWDFEVENSFGGDGDYPATYSFNNEPLGNTGGTVEGWNIDISDACYIDIVNIDGHDKVVRLDDWSSTNYITFTNNIDSQAQGTVEFYIRRSATTAETVFKILDDSNNYLCLVLENNNGHFRYYDGSYPYDYFPVDTLYSANIWYHIKIEFDCENTVWHCWIDGILISGSGVNYYGNPTEMTQVQFKTSTTVASQGNDYFYFDAIGYSWDPQYTIGDNWYSDAYYVAQETLNEINYQEGGWRSSYLYKDDFEGNAYVMVKDSDGFKDFSYIPITVKNVDPLVSIYDASIVSNFSFKVYRDDIVDNANFTIEVYSNEQRKYISTLGFDSWSEYYLASEKEELWMSLSKDWYINVNSTELPSNSIFNYEIILEFLNGDHLSISSNSIIGNGSNYGSWELYLNSYFYDPVNYHFKCPITFNTQIWDPSIDDIDLNLMFNTNYFLEIDCSNSLPIEHSYIETYNFGAIYYTVQVFEFDNKNYANISAQYEIASDKFTQNQFPVNLESQYTIYPIIDLSMILESKIGLNDLSILRYLEAQNFINVQVSDDDYGSNHLTVRFDTIEQIEFHNLSPKLETIIAQNGSTSRDVNFYLTVSDYDQIYEYITNFNPEANYFESNVVPNDLIISSGMIQSEGDYFNQDGNYTEFLPFHEDGLYRATYSFTDDVDNSNPDDWAVQEDAGDIKIINNLGEHDKVVEIPDVNGYSNYLYNTFSDQASGTVEFHIRSTNTYNNFYIFLRSTSDDYWGPKLLIQIDKICAFDGGTCIGLKSVSDNTWYHLRIDFECSNGQYQGLGNDKYFVYVNGIRYGSFGFYESLTSINRLTFQSKGSQSGYSTYIDAVGYSWDPNYHIGDNRAPFRTLDATYLFYLEGPNSCDTIEYTNLIYSYRTNVEQSISFKIYNYVANQYQTIDDAIYTTFITKTLSLSSDFYNQYNELKIKFEAENNVNDYSLDIDLLKFEYLWHKADTLDKFYNYSSIPNQPNDFTNINGLLSDWSGTMDYVDGSYTTFISENHLLEFMVEIDLEVCQEGDNLNIITLFYNMKTNIAQIISLYLFNFTSNTWYLIDSSIHSDFSNNIYDIPISREENLQITENYSSISQIHDFFNNDFQIRLKVLASNDSNNFELYLDMLKIEYNFISQYFISNNQREIILDVPTSIISDSTYYPGTYTFENDLDGCVPNSWSAECAPGCSATIINEAVGHKKVLQIYDNVNGEAHCWNDFPDQPNGTIEFWIFADDTTAANLITIKGSSGDCLHFLIRYDTFYFNGQDLGVLALDDTWYHISINFECTSGGYQGLGVFKCNIKINDTLYGDFDFNYNDQPKTFFCSSSSSGTGTRYLLDAISYSWDPYYEIGENSYPNSYLNQTFEIELSAMNNNRMELFKSCNINFQMKTQNIQEYTVSLYNFASESLIIFDTIISQKSYLIEFSFIFNNTDFINSDDNYKIRVNFYGINHSVSYINLTLYEFNIKYYWSEILIDCGYNENYLKLIYNLDKSSPYSYWYEGINSFDYPGEYLVIGIADDGHFISKSGSVINIFNSKPYGRILNVPSEAYEDEILEFEAEMFSTGPFANETRFQWAWGDSYYSFEQNPSHAWSKAGVYIIELFCKDCFGNTFTDTATITVLEKPPEIKGPFTFYGMEGQALILDVEIYDSILDEMGLNYRWYDETGQLIAEYMNPTIIRNNGKYLYRLEVEDAEGYISKANISVIVENRVPMVFVSSYGYYGAPGEGPHGEPGITRLELQAYGYDSFYDINDLKFNWTISNGNESYTTFSGPDQYSFIHYKCKDTKVYTGTVSVTDNSGATSTATFFINSFIDSDSDGLSDEFEYQLELYNLTQTLYDDDDMDGLINQYEWGITKTDSQNPDTDGDGLYDGKDESTGIGELILGTNPHSNDTDEDGLIDPFEFYGWTITTEAYGEIFVNSNPCKYDTDFDGLNDYAEYQAQTDPHNPDTDKDGLLDGCDPHPTKWDGDGDNLNDKLEVELGTDPNNTDTDGDGLTDGQEVLGWGFYTNPLSADSDHDFLADNAEIQTYRFERETKAKLNKPVSLWFKEHVKNPVSSQLAFTIAFGEYAEDEGQNIEYGIESVPCLEIQIIKAEEELILFNTTTNGTEDRYISHVVDLKQFLENLNSTDIKAESFDYFGEYKLLINNTEADCLLEQFEIEVAKYLDPNDEDYDNDGILDGVETGMLVEGSDTIDFKSTYWYEERMYAQPQGWWKFDDETKGAGVAEDFSGNELHGTLMNMGYENWVAGYVGPYALQFNGVDEYIDLDAILEDPFDGALGDYSQEFTIIAWLNPSDLSNTAQTNHGTQNCFFAKASDPYNDNLEIGVNTDGTIHIYLDTESHDTSANFGTPGNIQEGRWTFIVIRYEYGALSVQINEVVYESTIWQSGTTDIDAAVGSKVTIGCSDHINNYFNGLIDDVRVYNIALDEVNIAWLYNNGSGQSLDPISSGAPLTVGNGTQYADEFQLEIPSIGRVFDAELTFKIDSEEVPWGNETTIGTVEIELIKDEINCSLEDPMLVSALHYIYDGWDFSQEYRLDLAEYVANGTISEYYGKYILRIKIIDENFYDEYNFTLSEFCIEIDGWRQAQGLDDTTAWITDPAKADTDGDGWNDSYEIFTKGTNPVSVDTDGDGAWDPVDRDPHRDLIIEIVFIEGKCDHEYEYDPFLQGVVEFDVYNQEFYFTTTAVECSWNENDNKRNQRCSFGHTYYLNIEDDKTLQPEAFELQFELWEIMPRNEDGDHLGDKCLIDGGDGQILYWIGGEYHSYERTLDEEDKEDEELEHELKIKITTLALEKANMIAVYEANTTFTGRYEEQEHMNVIQLWVSDDGTGTPFRQGPNAIVISTSLFTSTKLNSYIQKEQIAQTPLYSYGENYQFISVDRDEGANSDGATNKVDFVIIRKEITSMEAMDVLELLTTCLVNESINEFNQTVYEEAKLYTFISTKLNGTKAVEMNLAVDVLEFIPWYNLYQNSPQGNEPNSKAKVSKCTLSLETMMELGQAALLGPVGVFLKLLEYCNYINGLMPTDSQLLAWVNAAVEFVKMAVLTYLGPFLWPLIRFALLILIYIALGLILLALTVAIGLIASILLPITLISGDIYEYTVNKVHGSIFGKTLDVGYKILEKFNSYLIAMIPYVYFFISFDENIAFDMTIKIFPSDFDFSLGGIGAFDASFSSSSSSNYFSEASTNEVEQIYNTQKITSINQGKEFGEILTSDSNDEELIIHNPYPANNPFSSDPALNLEGFGLPTLLLFEYKSDDGDNGDLYYKITRIDTDIPYMVEDGIINCGWDSSTESYIGEKNLELKEGIFDLYVKVLGEPIEQTRRFQVLNCEYLLKGLDFSLTLCAGINTLLMVNEIGTKSFPPNVKWTIFTGTLAYLFIPTLVSYWGMVFSDIGNNANSDDYNFWSEIPYIMTYGPLKQDYLDNKFSFGKGLILGFLINIAFVLMATYSKKTYASEEFYKNLAITNIKVNLIPKFELNLSEDTEKIKIFRDMVLLLNFFIGDIGLSYSSDELCNILLEDVFCWLNFGITCIYPWYLSIQAISDVSRGCPDWKSTAWDYSGALFFGMLSIGMTSALFHEKYIYF